VIVYIGAVAILMLFTVLLTRGTEVQANIAIGSRSWVAGFLAAVLVLAGIVTPILLSPSLKRAPISADASAPVQAIGKELMNDYVLPLEAIGLLLTAALIGAVVIAMQDKKADAKTNVEAQRVQPEAATR
jgi:NADH-quinone oxidoreductase subunit J